MNNKQKKISIAFSRFNRAWRSKITDRGAAAAADLPRFAAATAQQTSMARQRHQRFTRLSTRDQIAFVKRLAILIKTGIPILSALDILKKQANSKSSAHILGHLCSRLESGQSLSNSMSTYKKIFGAFAINIVRVGEISGTLDENLHYLADELKKKQELKRRIVSALVYPIFIVVATIAITILLTAYVFPKIMPVFQAFKFDLPWSTRVLIAISFIIQHDWRTILGGLIALVAGITLLLRHPGVRLWVDRNSLRLPVLGTLLCSYHVANFTRTLGLLLKSDVRIIDGLHILGETMSNTAYRKKFNEIADSAARGKKISAPMEEDSVLFPIIVAQMASVGESTGNLSSSLLYLSEMFEDEFNNMTKNLSVSIEPVLMIFIGVLVGFIAVSIITPIYEVTQSLHS